MIFFTGDTHGRFDRFDEYDFASDDVVIILGDSGLNYYHPKRAAFFKKTLSKHGCKFLMIHGNHEQRPEKISTYHLDTFMGGDVYVEDAFHNLFFAKDGSIFNLNGYSMLVVGGAYSVDKYYRQTMGFSWWPDEQPSEETKRYVEQVIANQHAHFDIIATHTCPFKYIPTETFLPGIDQSRVDQSTEEWLDLIEKAVHYRAWVCGHWHTDKVVDNVRFLFNSIIPIENLMHTYPKDGDKA